jgi:cell division protein DivIC
MLVWILKPRTSNLKHPFMKFIHHIPSFLKNKYLLVLTGFVVWMLFFDVKDVMTQYNRTQQLNDLEASKAFYQKQITETHTELDLLLSNPATLEKYAREKYYMKRDNEDLFIVVENQSDAKN